LILLTSASPVAKITGLSCWHPAKKKKVLELKISKILKLVAHTCNPSYSGAEQFEGNPGQVV
jgi:hypothetical protein